MSGSVGNTSMLEIQLWRINFKQQVPVLLYPVVIFIDQMSTPFEPLALGDEDALHRARLLNTEERAFKRVTKRLLGPDSFFNSTRANSDEDGEEKKTSTDANQGSEEQSKRKAEEYEKFREEITMDFAAFEANIVRTQLLFNSNMRERERYAAEKLRIQETAQQVRASTAELRTQLDEAQRALEMRKGWDRLAEKITNNRMLRTREEQHASIDKLNNEIAELERESREYAATWAERRQQFGRIVDEGMQMLRLIRDEKEEVERREGMEGEEEGDDVDNSRAANPSKAGTPLPEGAATPLHPGADTGISDGTALHPLSRSPLRGSPAPEANQHGVSAHSEADAEMADEGEVEDENPSGSDVETDTSRVGNENGDQDMDTN